VSGKKPKFKNEDYSSYNERNVIEYLQSPHILYLKPSSIAIRLIRYQSDSYNYINTTGVISLNFVSRRLFSSFFPWEEKTVGDLVICAGQSGNGVDFV
jgi:hypothetical protein